jgi:hypothetical protein
MVMFITFFTLTLFRYHCSQVFFPEYFNAHGC